MSLELRVTSPGKPETGSGTIRGGPEMGLPRSPRSWYAGSFVISRLADLFTQVVDGHICLLYGLCIVRHRHRRDGR